VTVPCVRRVTLQEGAERFNRPLRGLIERRGEGTERIVNHGLAPEAILTRPLRGPDVKGGRWEHDGSSNDVRRCYTVLVFGTRDSRRGAATRRLRVASGASPWYPGEANPLSSSPFFEPPQGAIVSSINEMHWIVRNSVAVEEGP
jgi:hypothetical protein